MLRVIFEKKGWRWVAREGQDVKACCVCGHAKAATIRLNLGHYVLRLCKEHRPNGSLLRGDEHVYLRISAGLKVARAADRKVKDAAAPRSQQLVLL